MAIASQTIRDLLENGVHFGHQTNKWNPKMKKYIFGAKSGIYIIDLQKTEEALNRAVELTYKMAAEGKRLLFAGTKKQAKSIIREQAQRCDMFYVEERWLGGCLTNFATIKKSVDRLDHLQNMKESEMYSSLAKKEKARLDREEQKLLRNLSGIRDMKNLPDCIVIVDSEAEHIAIAEARKLNIPVIALIDTNCDPDLIDYPIPGNDDAIRAIRYIVTTIADAAAKGRSEFLGTALDTPESKKAEEKAAPAEEKAEEKKDAPEEEKAAPAAGETKVEEEKPAEEIKTSPADDIEGDISLDSSGK